MSNIHYFPRYSQKENMVTNNTLLLFSQLYNNSTVKFNRFINSLLEENDIKLDTTVNFGQQVKGAGSTPDGVIEQESFKVLIETKLYGQKNLAQIEKHCYAFSSEDKQIILWINKASIETRYHKNIISLLNKVNENRDHKIFFVPTTFKNVCRCFNDIMQDYDIEMKELIDDFENFCSELKLIDDYNSKMRVVSSGVTFEQNMEYGIYYAPRERKYQNAKYLGLYKDKAVRGIGEVIGIADINYIIKADKLTIVREEFGTVTTGQKEKVKKSVTEAKEKFGYQIEDSHRFFFVKEYYETEYIKPTKGGLMGQQYFNLDSIQGFDESLDAEKIAVLLKGLYW